MPSKTAAFVAAALALAGASSGRAQESGQTAAAPSAEEMIEIAREAYRPPGLRRRCPPPLPGEIVVCAPDSDDQRVSSPTDDAIAAGEAVADGVPRAPDVFGIPRGTPVATGCFVPPCPPPMPPLIDVSAIPEPLTPEQARHVYRAEDPPNPAEASPAAAP